MKNTMRADKVPQGSTGIALYVQLASRLRALIVTGHWKLGDFLPSVADIASQYSVAIVTVRQALHVLAEEGLIRSERGRGTHVCGTPSVASPGLRSAINDPMVLSDGLTIRLLSKRTSVNLPAELSGTHQLAENYTYFKKLHVHDGTPFCSMELYVSADVLARFPPHAEKKRKINGLLFQYFGKELGMCHTSMTVAPADYELAVELKFAFAAPVARVIRQVCDKNDQILYAGVFWYRGDRFVLDLEAPADLMLSLKDRMAPSLG